jgi:hypothetical protein
MYKWLLVMLLLMPAIASAQRYVPRLVCTNESTVWCVEWSATKYSDYIQSSAYLRLAPNHPVIPALRWSTMWSRIPSEWNTPAAVPIPTWALEYKFTLPRRVR